MSTQLPLDLNQAPEIRTNTTAPAAMHATLQRACWECLRRLLAGPATAAELKAPDVGRDRYSARLSDLRRAIRTWVGLDAYAYADPFPKDPESNEANPTYRLAPWARGAAAWALERHDELVADKERRARKAERRGVESF